jgi:hypothetical protein
VCNSDSAVSVITRGCNQSANKIQSSERDPIIIVTCTPLHMTVLFNVKSTWYFQSLSPHQVLYILSHVMTLLTLEIQRNSLGMCSIALLVLLFHN